MKTSSRRYHSALALLMASTLFAGSPSASATLNWANLATGDWFEPNNWSGGTVPVTGDTAMINNGGTAAASGTATLTASSLDVGTGAGAVSGSVTTTTADLALGGGGNALRVGVATVADAEAVGAVTVGGSIVGSAPASASGTFRIGVASGDDALGEGTVSVTGDMAAFSGFVGTLGAGNGSSATGKLTVGGDLTGLAGVGAGTSSENAVASGVVSVTAGDLTPFAGLLTVGQTFGVGTVADGTVSVVAGDIHTTGATWVIGNARSGQATGQVHAAGVDASGGAVNGLFVGTLDGGGEADGTLKLGSGDLRLTGNASIGVASNTSGGAAQGAVMLDGALAAEGGNSLLRVGVASGGVFQTESSEVTGALTAAGVTGFRNITTGLATGFRGLGPEADGTLAVGAGGVVNNADPGGSFRIGVADAQSLNGVVTGPGPVTSGAATVGGDIAGYDFVDVGVVDSAGKATGALTLNDGTMTTSRLDIARVDDPPFQVLPPIDGPFTASAIGGVKITDGAVVVTGVSAGPPGFPGFPGLTRIGIVSAGGPDFDQTADGTLDLTRTRFESGLVFLGFGDGATGTLSAAASEIVVGDMAVAAQGGDGHVTLDDSSLTATADATRGLSGSLSLRGRNATLTATNSDVTLDGALSVVNSVFFNPDTAMMAMSGGTLSVGNSVAIGDFNPESRGELSLTDATATVGGNLRVGLSANGGLLFGEALLHLDGSLMDVFDALRLDFGGALSFGVGGLGRGLGGYGAIDAASADLLGGAAIVDFSGLSGPLGFEVAAFNLIAVANGFAGDFSLVSILNTPTGYSASQGFFKEGDGDVWRVTLTREVAPIPLPAGAWLLITGLLGLRVMSRRRAR